MQPVFAAVHKKIPTAFIVVDNCYGEFTQREEPSAFGAEIHSGRFPDQKPGRRYCATGGYMAGTRKAIEKNENGMPERSQTLRSLKMQNPA